MPPVDLVTVGEAFKTIFVGSRTCRSTARAEDRARFVSTIGGGAVITRPARRGSGCGSAIISGLSAEAAAGLRRDRVAVVNLKRASEAHAVTVALSTTRDRSFVTFNGVNDRLQPRLPAAVARQASRHIHFAFAPDNCPRWTRIVERLRARGVTTSWDFGWNPPLLRQRAFGGLVGSLDFVFVNEPEAALLAHAARLAAVFCATRATRSSLAAAQPVARGDNGPDCPGAASVPSTRPGPATPSTAALARSADASRASACGSEFVGARSTLVAAIARPAAAPRSP